MATGQSPSVAAALQRRGRRKGRPLPKLVALVAVVGLGWWGWIKMHPAPDPLSNMLTATVTRGDLVESVSATGSIAAQTGAEVHIGSQITGTIKHLYADVGTHVKAGQIIAELDLPDIKAQLDQSAANLAASQTKYQQQVSGVGMTRTQLDEAVKQAQAALYSSKAKLASAEAAANQQVAQTPTDIERGKTGVAAAQAALSTAKSNLAQVQASANLQIATAQEQLRQAEANATNSSLTLVRNRELLTKGFVATSVVDQAQATDTVNQSLVTSAQKNVQLVKEQVAASLQSSQDQVTQAQQNLVAAQAALASAEAENYTNAAKLADVNDSRAQVHEAETNLRTAVANTTQNLLKQQDVQQAKEAVNQAVGAKDYSQAQWNKTFIRTPITGTVLQLAAQQGETLAAGLSAPTLIIVADLNRLEADVYVDETDIGKIHLKQEADVVVDAFPKHVFKGQVVKIASGSTIQQGVVTYDVTVSIHDKRLRLKPDMTASVTVQTGTRHNVLLVPAEAVKVGTRGSTVSVITKKDGQVQVQPRQVKTGASDGVNTEITDGLQEGETIVLASLDTGGGRGGMSPFGPSGGKKGGGKKKGG